MWNEIGHYTCALSSCRRQRHHRRHHQIDSNGLHEKWPIHCAVGSIIIGDIGLVSANYICDDMAWPSDQNLQGKKKPPLHYINGKKSSESEQSLLHVMSLATRNIAHSFFNWMRQDNHAVRARAHTISLPYLRYTWRFTDWTCVRTRSLTLGHETGNCTHFVSQLNQV